MVREVQTSLWINGRDTHETLLLELRVEAERTCPARLAVVEFGVGSFVAGEFGLLRGVSASPEAMMLSALATTRGKDAFLVGQDSSG